jgi:hypothetical protein
MLKCSHIYVARKYDGNSVSALCIIVPFASLQTITASQRHFRVEILNVDLKTFIEGIRLHIETARIIYMSIAI